MDLFSRIPVSEFFTVAQINEGAKILLEENFPGLWILGEVKDLKKPSSGHGYFSLHDGIGSLRGVLFKPYMLRSGMHLSDGAKVLVRGKLSIYTPRGDFQLIAEEVRPFGIGDKELARKQLKEKLKAKGYFASERKKRLPTYPHRIGLITSPTGSAVRDMIEVLRKRWPVAEVWVAPVRVQGTRAPAEIALAIKQLNAVSAVPEQNIDVILLGRGGGSSEDLSAFDNETVAEAIYYSTIPIISAVGHEDDLTIADLVADLRAVTPTEAATKASPDFQKISEELISARNYLTAAIMEKLGTEKKTLSLLSQRKVFLTPFDFLNAKFQLLDDITPRLDLSLKTRIKGCAQQTAHFTHALEALSPLRVLDRGYTLTYHFKEDEENLEMVRSVLQLKVGDCLQTMMKDGKVQSSVISVEGSKNKSPGE